MLGARPRVGPSAGGPRGCTLEAARCSSGALVRAEPRSILPHQVKHSSSIHPRTLLRESVQTVPHDESFYDIDKLFHQFIDSELFQNSADNDEYADAVVWDGNLAPALSVDFSTGSGATTLENSIWFEPEESRNICPQELVLPPIPPDSSSGYFDGAGNTISTSLLNCSDGSKNPKPEWTYARSSPSLHIEQGVNPLILANSPRRARIKFFKDWLLKNAANPYPSEPQVHELAVATGLSTHRVRISLNNLRTRMKTQEGTHPDQVFNTTSALHDCGFQSNTSYKLLDVEHEDTGAAHIYFHGDSELKLSNGQGHPNCGTQSISSNIYSNVVDLPQIKELGSSSSAQRRGLPPMHPSGEKFRKRKGKRLYAPRYVTESGTPSISYGSNDLPLDQSPIYHCTVCSKAFKNVYGWRRHEESVHGFHAKEWVCMLNGAIIDGNTCAFCSELYPELDHNEQHSILKCLSKDNSERIFLRKDAMKQHVQQVHLTDMETPEKRAFKVPDDWHRDVDAQRSDLRGLWCGFCQITFDTTANRMEHVAAHFRDGKDMSAWLPRPVY